HRPSSEPCSYPSARAPRRRITCSDPGSWLKGRPIRGCRRALVARAVFAGGEIFVLAAKRASARVAKAIRRPGRRDEASRGRRAREEAPSSPVPRLLADESFFSRLVLAASAARAPSSKPPDGLFGMDDAREARNDRRGCLGALYEPRHGADAARRVARPLRLALCLSSRRVRRSSRALLPRSPP